MFHNRSDVPYMPSLTPARHSELLVPCSSGEHCNAAHAAHYMRFTPTPLEPKTILPESLYPLHLAHCDLQRTAATSSAPSS